MENLFWNLEESARNLRIRISRQEVSQLWQRKRKKAKRKKKEKGKERPREVTHSKISAGDLTYWSPAKVEKVAKIKNYFFKGRA